MVPSTHPSFSLATDVENQGFSLFLNLQIFNTVPNVVVTTNQKITLLPFHNCNFATVTNGNVHICRKSAMLSCERVIPLPRSYLADSHFEITALNRLVQKC